MKTKWMALVLAVVAPLHYACSDVLELKSGTVLTGHYQGGTAGTVRFATDAGVEVYATQDVLALTFTANPAPANSTASVAAAPPPTAAPKQQAPTAGEQPKAITLPAGTALLVRTSDPISTAAVRSGDRFECQLDADLVVGSTVVAPKGTAVYGTVVHAEQAKRVRGQSVLEIQLTGLATKGGVQPLHTNSWSSEAERAGGAVIRGAAAGAAIGGIADGSDGAGTGALIGATAGALKKGDSIVIPKNQLIEFHISAPTQIQVAQ